MADYKDAHEQYARSLEIQRFTVWCSYVKNIWKGLLMIEFHVERHMLDLLPGIDKHLYITSENIKAVDDRIYSVKMRFRETDMYNDVCKEYLRVIALT